METTHNETHATPVMNHQRRRILWLLGAVFLLLGIMGGVYWLVWGQFEEYTDDAYVAGNLVQLMPQVAGTITAINTDDTYLALEGQELIKLDPADTLVALQNAAANLAQTVRQVRQYYQSVKEAQSNLTRSKADFLKAQLDLKRRQGLVGVQAVSREEMQHMLTAVQAAQAEYDAALHSFISTKALVENSQLYSHPLVEQAKAQFKVAYLNRVRTVIYAPVTGLVAKRHAQVGQQVSQDSVLLAIVPLNEVWIEANFKENQLSRIRMGQPVVMTADANKVTYHGKVVGLSAGTGSAFSLLPPQNATGNWIKIVQRLPVRIALQPKELAEHPLQIGLSMRVTVYTRDDTGPQLSPIKHQGALYSTHIFNDQLAHAEHEIETILHQNAPNVSLTGIRNN